MSPNFDSLSGENREQPYSLWLPRCGWPRDIQLATQRVEHPLFRLPDGAIG